MNKSQLIEEMELDFIKHVEGNIEERKKLLPLTDIRQIKGLIYNLLTSEKWRKQISYNDYSEILDIWFNRIAIPQKNNYKDAKFVAKFSIEKRAEIFGNLVLKINCDNNILGISEVLSTNGKSFIEYWTEHGENDRKMRFEKETAFDIKKRLLRWKNNNYNNAKPTYTDKLSEYLNR